MKKARPYISLLMLALLLFPLGKKAIHEVGHLSEIHCDVKEKHYCAVEHTCDLCDYVFSSQSLPPETSSQQSIFREFTIDVNEALVFNTLTPKKFTLSLRGPPQA